MSILSNLFLASTATIASLLVGTTDGLLTLPALKHKSEIPVDYDVYAYNKDEVNSSSLVYTHTTGTIKSTGRPFSAYYATFHPDFFSFKSAAQGHCPELVQTHVASQDYDCDYSTNGGFFTWDMPESGSLCLGNLIVDSEIIQMPTDGSGTNRANFGITTNGSIALGFFHEQTLLDMNFTQLMTGCGWLVRNGISFVNSSYDLSYNEGGFTMEKAPRTAVGLFKNGSMILFEVDGEEDINAGPDLFEMAELMVDIGVESAVNIDGGGSSVSVYHGEVVDEPTCKDTPEICERAVASITCVRKELL